MQRAERVGGADKQTENVDDADGKRVGSGVGGHGRPHGAKGV